MLFLVEDNNKKIALQEKFNGLLAKEWVKQESRLVVWRPDSRQFDITHDGRFWYVSVPPSADQKIRRFWNALGIYKKTGGLGITVEINVPTESNGRNVSGFFARDPATGIVYLMHDGGIGGGTKGVGRSAFLSWSGVKLIPVTDSEGRSRLGIIVAPLIKGRVAIPVAAFINRVSDFKQAIRDGRVPLGKAAQRNRATYDDYYLEFSGKKKGQRAKEVEYISRHGNIVDELTRWRPALLSKRERIVKNAYIDLGIEVAGALKVLYEVKTSASRQNLYGAIGQIMVHGNGADKLQRYVVVPAGEAIATDVYNALQALDINVLRYEISGKNVKIR